MSIEDAIISEDSPYGFLAFRETEYTCYAHGNVKSWIGINDNLYCGVCYEDLIKNNCCKLTLLKE